MNHSLRLTPSNSPFFKNTTPRSPTKSRNEEAGLRLKTIIGTTTAGVNGFDRLPAKRQFAYCAGSAAVVAAVEEELKVTQRFFRARPTAGNHTREGGGAFPATPTPNDARNRAFGHVRDHATGGSPLGAASRDWSDSPSGKTATAKDRVKAATSVALSPNGKWVALGETGYKPRVVLFSNDTDSGESPVYALAEHTFGVQALRFSPDSRFLASLGTANDGFLYLWNIDDRSGAASLHSSNKCTVVVNDMLWVGKNLITIGLRFIKVWRPNEDSSPETRTTDLNGSLSTPKAKNADFGNSILSPRQKMLAGKNSLLGDLLDCNFVCATPLANDSAVLCAETGEIAILDDISKTQTLRMVATVDFAISAVRVDGSGVLHVLGSCDESQQFSVAKLTESAPIKSKRERRQSGSPTKSALLQTPAVIATSSFADVVLEIDSRRNIRLARPAMEEQSADSVYSHLLPAHNDSVTGAGAVASRLHPDAAFFTFAGNGVFRLWSADGMCASQSLTIPAESSAGMYDQTNELRSAASLITDTGEYLIAGDRYGTLTLLDLATGDVATQIRAHSAEIADLVTFERGGVHLIATCSRDRTIQLFAWQNEQLELLQTLAEHTAAVSGLLATVGGDRLLSYSQDRTVNVREAMLRDDNDPASVAYVMTRSLALKSSPISICTTAHEDEILIASMDRCIGVYNVKTGRAGFNFKCSDADGGEAVSLSKIAYEPSLNGNPAIIGISGNDKSVRIYSEYGMLTARDWGHTEGITGLAVLRDKRMDGEYEPTRVRVVTVAADSTVFVWDTMPPSPPLNDSVTELNGPASSNMLASPTPLRPPLRKVISFSELSRFKREKSSEDGNQSSTLSQRQPSPQRLRKKPSKASMIQAPKLEPAFRGEHARRRSLRKRSPSPPSPGAKKDHVPTRKQSLGMTIRSKSSENVLDGVTSPTSTSTGFGSITASTESATRTLRAYRKKLSTPSALDSIAPDTLQELEAELRLVLDATRDRVPSKKMDDGTMVKVLEEASEKIVDRLDERIKERVEDEMRRTSGANSLAVSRTPSIALEGNGELDAVTGAMENVKLGQ